MRNRHRSRRLRQGCGRAGKNTVWKSQSGTASRFSAESRAAMPPLRGENAKHRLSTTINMTTASAAGRLWSNPFVHDKNPSPAEVVDINASSSGVVIRFVASRIYQTLSPNPSPNGGGAFLSCTKVKSKKTVTALRRLVSFLFAAAILVFGKGGCAQMHHARR